MHGRVTPVSSDASAMRPLLDKPKIHICGHQWKSLLRTASATTPQGGLTPQGLQTIITRCCSSAPFLGLASKIS